MTPPLYPMQSDGPHPIHFRGITLSRLDKFDSGPYNNILNVLYEDRTDSNEFIQFESWSSPGRTKTPFKEAIRQQFKSAKKGDSFGPSWTNHWFRVTINLPSSWASSKTERIQLEWDPSCEAMVFDTEGTPQQGITGGFGGDRRVDYILNPEGRKGTYKFYIEISGNGMFGNGLGEPNNPPDNNRYFKLESADIVIPRMEAWRLLWDFRTIRDLAKLLPENSPLGNLSMEVANKIMNTFKVDDLKTIASCREIAEKVLGHNWEKLGAKIYKGNPSDSPTWAIGNCHIDDPWLWPNAVTRQKTARSWSTQLDLMDRYPEHRFVASQAQQFAWLELDYPSLFQKIQAKVKEGQFQPIGACWVEMDCNLPSGEALCRQFLFGQRYFKSKFGEYCRTFWLPDSFGYSSQLPQLCRSAGMDFFFTQKLSWSQFNAPVHTSFEWVGQDGSQILTHMTPVNTYTAQASVEDVINSIKNHKSLQSGASNSLLAFGNGDGGGGPLSAMNENLRRCRAVAEKSGELPKVTCGQSVELFFEDILKKSDEGKDLPNWNGELYLELHRGTLTSHGSIKKGNRKLEILLRELEYAATLASVTSKHYNYPKDEMDPLWEGVLLNQSHDTLPGSAIGMVYIDAEKIYAEVTEKGNALLEDAFKAILPSSEPLSKGNCHSSGDELVAINTSPSPRRELVKVSLETARARSNAAIQLSNDGAAYVLFENEKGDTIVGTQTMKEVEQKKIVPARARVVGDSYHLSNGQLSIKVSPQGRITSIVDLELERELIIEGKTAGFIIYEDQPLNWMAWDVDIFHLETKTDINASSIKVAEDGPLRSSLEITYHFGQSVVKAILSLDALPMLIKSDALSMLRFETTVDWHERNRFLKFELPLQITSQFATYENQFGFVQRPTHRNTTWDRAKFEVVAHKFADLSEFGYGVAILNDCKYGYATSGSTMTLSLLRGPTVPDADQDQGEHTFAFAIQPHRGSFSESDIPVIARLFNSPQHIRRIPRNLTQSLSTLMTTGGEQPFILTGARNVILDTVKRGEDDHFGHGEEKSKKVIHDQVIILRLYEAHGGAAVINISSEWNIESVKLCDILERDLEDVQLMTSDNGRSSFKVVFRGFQVVTLKVLVSCDKKRWRN